MKRYFLISYTGVTGNSQLHHGCLYISGFNFPSLNEIQQAASEVSNGATGIVITTIYEFKSESDYQTFIAA